VLLGANGTGKTSLLAAIRSAVVGRAVSIPQDADLALFCATVDEELRFGPIEQRLSAMEVNRRVAAASQASGLVGLMQRPPLALSRGQRVRVAVASAVTAEPDLLLLDEPTAGQDRWAAARLLQGAARIPGAVVVATHDVGLALRWADRVLVLAAGGIARDTTADALLKEPGETVLPPLAEHCRQMGLSYRGAVAAVEDRWTHAHG
jgi:energy-coupling factor transporter ATP-binding protein EcfA2